MRTDDALNKKEDELNFALMQIGLPDELIVDLNMVGQEDGDLDVDSLSDFDFSGIRHSF